MNLHFFHTFEKRYFLETTVTEKNSGFDHFYADCGAELKRENPKSKRIDQKANKKMCISGI